MANQFAQTQPPFDSRIRTLTFPLSGGQFGQLQRGFMVWEKPIPGYGSKAEVQFLYNPSSVTADYSMSNSSVASAYLFPTGFNDINLKVPLSQTVEFSLLYDRTYELWGSYNTDGTAKNPYTPGANIGDPRVVGVLADIQAMQQFTGMFVAYSDGSTNKTSPSSGSLTGWQGIMQLIPSYLYFGGGNSAATSLWYYGYISEWDVTVTHWTQYMIPQRCVINITFTMLPPPQGSSSTSNLFTQNFNPGSTTRPNPDQQFSLPAQPQTTMPTSGVSGR